MDIKNEIENIYTDIDVAVAELKKRHENHVLQEKIELALTHGLPAPLKQGLKNCIARNVLTPNVETILFNNLTIKTGIDSLCFEYYSDKFVTLNKLKLSLARLTFISGIDNSKVDYLDIINMKENERKSIGEIRTYWGEKLVDFHHNLSGPSLNNVACFDLSDWYKQIGEDINEKYFQFLTLFVKNGILFENFLLKDSKEIEFTKNIVLPAFKRVCNLFEMKPLIVRLLPKDNEEDIRWCYYEMSNIIK